MKHFLILLIILLTLPITTLAEDELPRVFFFNEELVPATGNEKSNYDDDRDYDNFSGRLYIDDIDIDVALYNSNKQDVVDRKDSAAYFNLSYAPNSMIVADHNTHAFRSLEETRVGTIARIEKEDGTIIRYKCISTFKGHNTGKGITDQNGNSVVGKSDLLMYTCFDGWRNVWVTLWNEAVSEGPLDKIMRANEELIQQLLQNLNNPLPAPHDEEEIELIFTPID